jgi:hypothetical protein
MPALLKTTSTPPNRRHRLPNDVTRIVAAGHICSDDNSVARRCATRLRDAFARLAVDVGQRDLISGPCKRQDGCLADSVRTTGHDDALSPHSAKPTMPHQSEP